ncbi:MAG: CRISPR-associated endonuclease Cas1 [Chloroflexi bacterium]|nr:MAG: CRISPR-associated endonuclease Cas1 [Chloroflexota bacterium]
MSTLYLIEPGSRLEKEYGRLLIVKDDEVLFRVPIRRVTQVVLIGHTGTTTPALQALLHHKIPLLLVNRNGKLRGRLLPATHGNLPLRQQQHRRNDDTNFCLRYARALIAAKIHNQRTLALRLARRHSHLDTTALPHLKKAIITAQQADSINTLMGIEGMAARHYFHLYRQAFASRWQFTNRNRRPPKDPVNALLSLGYTFLGHAMMTALEAAGLDPYLGYFHAEKYNRPALALDLLELFRAPVVDSLTLVLLNKQVLRPTDFQVNPKTGGIYLSNRGLRRFLQQFSSRLESEIKVRELGRTISYRKLFEVEARKIARFIMNDTEPYQPFRAR